METKGRGRGAQTATAVPQTQAQDNPLRGSQGSHGSHEQGFGLFGDYTQRALSYLVLGSVAAGRAVTYNITSSRFPEFLQDDLLGHAADLAEALIEARESVEQDIRAGFFGSLPELAFAPGGKLHAATRAVCAELVKLGAVLSEELKDCSIHIKVCDAFDSILPNVFREEAERLHQGLLEWAQYCSGKGARQ